MKNQLISSIKKLGFGIILTFILFPTVTMATANKIVVVAPSGSESVQAVQALKQGFVTAMGLQFNVATQSYSLDSGYTIEFESDTGKIYDALKSTDVIAVICDTSVVCSHALSEHVPNDVLVIAVTATSNELKKGANILRLAPDNSLQAKLIHDDLFQDIGTERFAIIYEPDIYAMDFLELFMSKYFTDITFDHSKPTFVASIPFHDFIANLDKKHKTIHAEIALKMLRQLQVSAVLYLGYSKGFATLTDPELGGDHSVAKHWYASDEIYEDVKGFPHLKLYDLFEPNSQESKHREYFYGYDAGKFLSQVIANYQPQETSNREEFLQIAKKTVLAEKDSLTGAKSFTAADANGRFSVKTFDEQGEFEINDVTVSGVHEHEETVINE
ncbi:MAG: ABC transporter substrate-binding protein [Candidatus Marithrix sp.]|nr:ABC transporter substrate-binding protein [Candidatus Marithrix sp.]